MPVVHGPVVWTVLFIVGFSSINGDDPGTGIRVFGHGEEGYPCIREPSLLRVGNSSRLLAFADTRCGAGDWCYPSVHFKQLDHQDSVFKTSDDNGLTWSPLRVLYKGALEDGCSKYARKQGQLVYDEVRGMVVYVFRDSPLHKSYVRSTDGGDTWSPPLRMDLGMYNTTRPFPGRGLQLSSSNPYAPHRLLFVTHNDTNNTDVVIYTDDGGDSWVASSTVILGAGEAMIVELTNGTLLLNAREKPGGNDRVFSVSHDGGTTWSSGWLVQYLPGVTCMGSFLSGSTTAGKAVLLYSHPGYTKNRDNGTVWVSMNQATSFTPYLRVTAHDQFSYSCLSDLPTQGNFGLLYETGSKTCTEASAACRIMFTNFTVS